MASDVQFHLDFGGYRRSSARRSPSCREAGGVAANSPASKMVTRLRRTGVQAFSKLPPPARLAVLHARGRYAPWEEGFDFTPPTLGAGEVAGAPDFVGIGVQKAGTSWWYELIAAHPQVTARPDLHKERHYFDRFAMKAFGPAEVAGVPRLVPPPTRHNRWRVDARLHAHALGPGPDGRGRVQNEASRSPPRPGRAVALRALAPQGAAGSSDGRGMDGRGRPRFLRLPTWWLGLRLSS